MFNESMLRDVEDVVPYNGLPPGGRWQAACEPKGECGM